MVKIKDLIEWLRAQDQDIKVIWGISEYPPDHEKRNPTLLHFPAEIFDYPEGEKYLYFQTEERARELEEDIAVMQSMSGWFYIKRGIRCWLKGGWYRRYRKEHYADKYVSWWR